MIVRDLPWILRDPAKNFIHGARAINQPLHGEEGVVAHLLVDEVPRLLLAVVQMRMGLIMWRREMGDLRVRVVMLVGLVMCPVGVQTGLINGWVIWRLVDMRMMGRERVMMVVQHGRPSSYQADAAGWFASTTTVHACGVHTSEGTWTQ